MSNSSTVLVQNLRKFFERHHLKPSHFADLAVKNGIDLSRSFISRLMSGASINITICKLDAINETMRILEPSSSIQELLNSNQLSTFSHNDLGMMLPGVSEAISDMSNMEWVTIRSDVPLSMVCEYICKMIEKKITSPSG